MGKDSPFSFSGRVGVDATPTELGAGGPFPALGTPRKHLPCPRVRADGMKPLPTSFLLTDRTIGT